LKFLFDRFDYLDFFVKAKNCMLYNGGAAIIHGVNLTQKLGAI